MTTGITRPACSLVLALNSLQNPMMLTPCWPSAGPTGGAGLACPAGICNLICPVIFFAILKIQCSVFLALLHLPVFQFHWRIPPENVHRDLQLSSFRLHFLDHPAKVKERSVIDLNSLADIEADLRFLMLFRGGNLVLDRLHFVRRSRRGRLSTDEPDYPLRFFDKIPWLFNDAFVLVQKHHVHKHISRPKLPRGNRFFLIPD